VPLQAIKRNLLIKEPLFPQYSGNHCHQRKPYIIDWGIGQEGESIGEMNGAVMITAALKSFMNNKINGGIYFDRPYRSAIEKKKIIYLA
jgi:hypothetical protein